MKNAFGGLVCVYYGTQMTQTGADLRRFFIGLRGIIIKKNKNLRAIISRRSSACHNTHKPIPEGICVPFYTPTQLITPNAVPIDVKIVINVWITIFQISFLFAMLFN